MLKARLAWLVAACAPRSRTLECARCGARTAPRPRPPARSKYPMEGVVMTVSDPFGARAPLGPGLPDFYKLSALAGGGAGATATLGMDLDLLPVTIKILLENVLRHAGGGIVREEDVATLAAWTPGAASAPGAGEIEIPFMPARVILQDFTGVPAVVDMAAMRAAQ